MDRKAIGPEAIVLAGQVIVQAQGDTQKARRVLAQAHAWTCTPDVDPTFKPEPATDWQTVARAAGWEPCDETLTRRDGDFKHFEVEIADLTAKLVKLGALVTEKDAELRDLTIERDKLRAQLRMSGAYEVEVQNLRQQVKDLTENAEKANRLLLEKDEQIMGFKVNGKPLGSMPTPAPAPVVPAPVPVPPATRSVAPAANPDVDPFAGMSPRMAEWARKRAAEVPSNRLDID